MTPEEWARTIKAIVSTRDANRLPVTFCDVSVSAIAEVIRAAVLEAVEDEREACATIAEEETCGIVPESREADVIYADGYSNAADNVAAAIRARNKP